MAEVSRTILLNDSNNGRTKLPKSDRFDPARGTPAWLRSELKQLLPEERILHRPLDLIAFAADASFYRLIPKVVAHIQQPHR